MKRRHRGFGHRFLSAATTAALLAIAPGAAFAACVSPAGSGGDMWFNEDHAVLQYCNGTDWIAMRDNLDAVTCDTTPTTYNTPGTYAYMVPPGCGGVVIQAYGAGGAGNSSGYQNGGGGGGGSVVQRDSAVLLVVGGGGGGGGVDRDSGGGGGGYATATASVTWGEQLNVWVGGGGQPSTLTNSGAGGSVDGGASVGGQSAGQDSASGYGGGSGSMDDATGTEGGGDSVYGGGGGVGKDKRAEIAIDSRKKKLGNVLNSVESAFEKMTSGYRHLGNGLVNDNPRTVLVLRRD
jgi:hypothetical protein